MNKETVQLKDGSKVSLRPIQPQDIIPILEMHERLSSETVYNRYLRAFTPTFEEIEQLCYLDYHQGAAFVVTLDTPWETVIALVYYILDDAFQPAAEVAFLIEDRFQGLGLGAILFQYLSQHARLQGIQILNAYTHLGNSRMRQLIRRSGLPYRERIDYGMREIKIELSPLAA